MKTYPRKTTLLGIISILSCCLLSIYWSACNISPDEHQALTQDMPKSSLFSKHADKLVDLDDNRRLFQFRVLNQKSSECSAHQERNLLFMLDILESDKSEFSKKYQRMISEEAYEDLMAHVECRLVNPSDAANDPGERAIPQRNERRVRMNPNLNKLVNQNPNFTDYLPAKSRQYLKDIITISIHGNTNFLTRIKAIANQELAKIEQQALPPHAIDDSASLVDEGGSWQLGHRFLTAIGLTQRLTKRDALVPIALSHYSVGTILHATAVVVRKSKGIIDFVFMDPLNWKFSEQPRYKEILYFVQRMSADSQYNKRTLVRAGYLSILDLLRDGNTTEGTIIALEFHHMLTVVEQLNLFNDEFYKKYYAKNICNLLNTKLADGITSLEYTIIAPPRPSSPDAKADLWQRFKCTNL